MARLVKAAPAELAASNQVRPQLVPVHANVLSHPASQASSSILRSRENVAPLVPPAPSRAVQEANLDEDWSSSLELIRQAAARTRQQQQDARSLVQRSQELAKYCVAQASATAKAAEERAEAAEALVRSLSHQLQETKARLQGTEQQLQQAQARGNELRLWLKRLHDSIDMEFHSLTVG